MAVDQNADLVNSDAEEAGDAFMAWALLSTRLGTLPHGARTYFENLIQQIEAFDPHEDQEIALTCGLEVPIIRAKPRKRLGTKSQHDYAHIFDWVALLQRREESNLDAALWEYIEMFELEKDAYETIKSAYHTVRRTRLATMDQDRPHFTRTKV